MIQHESASGQRTHSALVAILLAAVSGYVDGVGIIYLSGVFVSFMSGNTTSAAVALGTANWTALAHVVAAIPLYLVGIVIGALILGWGARGRVITYVVIAASLTAFLIFRLATDPQPTSTTGWSEIVTLALLVLPMAMLNTTLRHVGARSVGIGYVTGTRVSMGEHLAGALRTRSREDLRAAGLYGSLWLAFFVGGVAGAFAVTHVGAWVILAPIVVIALICALDPAARASLRTRR